MYLSNSNKILGPSFAAFGPVLIVIGLQGSRNSLDTLIAIAGAGMTSYALIMILRVLIKLDNESTKSAQQLEP